MYGEAPLPILLLLSVGFRWRNLQNQVLQSAFDYNTELWCTHKKQSMDLWLFFSSALVSTSNSVPLTAIHSQAKDSPAHND